eukprot:9673569-Lingulodinium_polyedra.AAC.1
MASFAIHGQANCPRSAGRQAVGRKSSVAAAGRSPEAGQCAVPASGLARRSGWPGRGGQRVGR